jgi:acyl dehydratase
MKTMITKDTPVGQELSGKPKKMTWERIAAFSGGAFNTPGWPKKNIHTDLEFSKETGLTKVYVSGTQYFGHIAEFMIDHFGEEWLSGGQVSDLKLIAPVTEGDIVRAKAIVQSKEEKGATVTYTLELWSENQNGEKVAVGTATGVVR